MNTNPTNYVPHDPIQNALIDPDNYHDQENWFRLLQEDGIGFTPLDASRWAKKPNKKKNRHITFQRMHYKNLFTLAEIIYSLYLSKKETYFAYILKNKSDAVHKIGTYIVNNRYLMAKGDIYSVGQGFDYQQFTLNEEYKDRKSFYFLEQGHLLKYFLEMWTKGSLKDQLKVTTSDRLRAIGLLFQEDLREKIPFILSATDRHKRSTLDEWSGKRNICYHLLTQRFVDSEYVVTFPPKWFYDQTKQKINQKFDGAEGKTWDDFNQLFEPNDPARMSLPRTESFLKHVLGSTISAYNTVMSDYTKNTGGGDGDDAAITIWQEREETDILNYDRKLKNNVYLTIVHMYNKMYDYPLVVVKDSIPTEFQIDDSRTETLSSISERRAKRKQRSHEMKGNDDEDGKAKKWIHEMVDAFDKKEKEKLQPNDIVYEKIQRLSKSNEVATTFENQLSILHEKKELLQTEMRSNHESLSKIHDIEKEIEHKQLMLKVVKAGLVQQTEDLQSIINTSGEV